MFLYRYIRQGDLSNKHPYHRQPFFHASIRKFVKIHEKFGERTKGVINKASIY